MGDRQPATDGEGSHRVAAPYPVLVGPAIRPTPASRVRAALTLGVLTVVLGVAAALLVGALLVVAGMIVSGAVN
jgi:hypothetical protein